MHPIEMPEESEDPLPKNSYLKFPNYDQLQQNDTVNSLELSDQDLMKIISNCESEHLIMMTQHVSTSTSSTTKQAVAKKSSPRIPLFHKFCHIGTLTINFNNN